MTTEKAWTWFSKAFLIGTFMSIALILASREASAHSASSSQHTIIIETRIDSPDPQAGMKSDHRITVNFSRRSLRENFATGTTTIFGKTLSSIRDKFKSRAVDWYTTAEHRTVKLNVSGHTASGVRVLPGIDYELEIYLSDDGEVAIDGCHDGYPSYKILVNGRRIYSYKHKPMRLYKLFGKCDITMRRRTGEEHGWDF